MNLWAKFLSVLAGIGKNGVSISVPITETGYRKDKVDTKDFNIKPNGFKPTYIVIHHSFTKDQQTVDWSAIRKYHVETNGWKDIGYHLGIEQVDGYIRVMDGRPIGEVGAHALGFNANSVGICVVGNYDIEAPSEAKLGTLAVICRKLQRIYHIPPDNVIGHRDTYPIIGKPVEKTCPGKLFDLVAFRARLLGANEV